MSLSIATSVIGAFSLILRIWLCEKKIPDILLERRGFLSRIANYYYFIGLIINFSNNIFNLAICTSLPILLIGFFINDIPAYKNFNKTYSTEGKKYWILLEGLTLHPPMIITGIIFYIIGLNNIFPSLDPISAISSLILGIVPLLLFDNRWKLRKPIAIWMLIGGIGTWIGIVSFVHFL